MDDIVIELLDDDDNVIDDSSLFSLPSNFITVGKTESDSIKIYIKQDVYKRIEKFAKEDISKEVGSILIGEYIEENNSRHLIISAYIEAKFADASASTLTFTHKTWEYIYKEKEKNYPDKVIVGWQHTHPGYGIFLSNYDIFIQENFFNLDWQVAYVVDPIADTRGFFEWKNNKISKMDGFHVYDNVGRSIKISEKPKKKKNIGALPGIILSFLLMVSVILTISFGIERNTLKAKLNAVTSPPTSSEQDSTADELPKTTTIPVEPDNPLNQNTETFRVYTIQSGDTLKNICSRFDIDYIANISKIKKINNLSDINKIYTGQTLYLPLQ